MTEAKPKKDKPENFGWNKVDGDGKILEKTITNHPSIFPFTKTIVSDDADQALQEAKDYDARLEAANKAEEDAGS